MDYAGEAMIQMLDHTAYVGFEVSGAPTLEGLFEEARRAAHDDVRAAARERRGAGVGGLCAPDLETPLLVRWINEVALSGAG